MFIVADFTPNFLQASCHQNAEKGENTPSATKMTDCPTRNDELVMMSQKGPIFLKGKILNNLSSSKKLQKNIFFFQKSIKVEESLTKFGKSLKNFLHLPLLILLFHQTNLRIFQ